MKPSLWLGGLSSSADNSTRRMQCNTNSVSLPPTSGTPTWTDNAGGMAPTSCYSGRRLWTPPAELGRRLRLALYQPVAKHSLEITHAYYDLCPGLDPVATQTLAIDQEIEPLHAYIAAQRWHLPESHSFRDDGYSSPSLRWPGWDRLHDYVHQVLLLEALQKNGCQGEFLGRPMNQDPYDLPTSASQPGDHHLRTEGAVCTSVFVICV